MPNISQLPAQLDLKGVVGSPFILTVTTDTTAMSAVSVVCYDSAGTAITAFAPTTSIQSATTIAISWTAAQTTAQGVGAARFQLVATISGTAALPLIGGTFTLCPPGTAGASASSTATLTVYTGSTLATLTVTVGGATSGSGANLTYTASPTGGTVLSDTGTDATLTLADGTNAGLMAPAQHTKLAGIETGATADQTAAEILAALLTVDGSGSGLDADLLDGNSAAAFATAGHNHAGVYEAVGVAAALVDDLSGVSDAATARTNLGLGSAATASAASTTASGIIEIATNAESLTGTDAVRAVAPDSLAYVLARQSEVFVIAVGDETTAITTGTAKVTWRMPFAFTVTAVRSSLTTASSSGLPTVDINEAGTSILSTKLTIDANELTSTTAATAAVISDSALADDALMTIDIDTAGTGAAGLKVYLIGTRA